MVYVADHTEMFSIVGAIYRDGTAAFDRRQSPNIAYHVIRGFR